MARRAYCPDAGDIIKIEFDEPSVGKEMEGYHPALVLSPREYNDAAKLCVVCPMTSRGEKDAWEVDVPFGLETGGVVISDQPKSISWSERKSRFVEKAPPGLVEKVRGRVAALLGIDAVFDDVEDELAED